jgi:mono/diheme cytochrome c family protein
MRYHENAFVVVGLLLTGLAAAPLAAQTSPPINQQLQRPQQRTFVPGQRPAVPTAPTLAFDAETKQYDASPGEQTAPFTFNLTNVWTNEIIIDRVQASCGCTTASLPANPWHLPAQGSGQVQAKVNLQGKMGLITKTLTFFYRMTPGAATASRMVYLKVNIPPPPAVAGEMSLPERMAAMNKSKADAQAIFKGDCAKCHAEKGRAAFGQDLYALDCGICHESSHRESLVPDLHALKQATDFDYWKTIITFGKPHTMMPGFAAAQGGPLSEAQIISLATYLNHTISHHFSTVMTNAANAPLVRGASLQ